VTDSSLDLALVGSTPHLVWHTRPTSTSEIWHAAKSGAAWTANLVYRSTGIYKFNGYPSLAADSSGRLHVAFCDKSYSASDSIVYVTNTSGTWVSTNAGSSGSFCNQTSIVARAASGPSIAYATDNKISHMAPGTPWWSFEPIGAGSWYVEMVADPWGGLHAAFAGRVALGTLQYATRTGSTWTQETVDPNQNSGTHASLAIDSLGHPHIAYYGGSVDLLYATHDGTRWILSTVDSAGDVGSYASIALDGSNQPWISYYDATQGDLKLAH